MKALTIAIVGLMQVNNSESTPVQKVLTLLHSMLEKGKKERHAEQEQFAKFKEFCDEVLYQKEVDIGEEAQHIDRFTAHIRQERAAAAVMGDDMMRLDQDIANWNNDIKAATNVRNMENAHFNSLHEDYSESIDALMSAITTLEKQSEDHAQASAASLVQLQTLELIPAVAKKAIDVFVQQSGEDVLDQLSVRPPEANAYEFQSHGVIEMLRKLEDKFIEERRQIESDEQNSQYAYERLIQDLNNQIGSATKRSSGKATSRAKQLAMKASDKGERKEEIELRSNDMSYRKDLAANCKIKSLAFESRQKLRADEIVALEKAIQIISGEGVAGAASKHLPAMVQKNGTSFSQLRSGTKNWNRVAVYLQDQAAKLNNRMLADLAKKVALDPFVKVKKMLKDLYERLEEQAAQEANHKGWCDSEMVANQQTRREKTDLVDRLQAEIDQLQASIAKLTEGISELRKSVAELDAAMAEQTKIRQEEKATNAETVAEAKEAQNAVDQALSVLREFYVKAGEATSFVQKGSAPEIFDDAYKGMGDESGPVLGMLEVILTDFARLESATKASESSAKQEYDEFMEDSKKDKGAKTGDIEIKVSKKQDETSALSEKQGDLARSQKELDSAIAFYEKLRPSCVESGVAYEDRVAQRNEEIKALKEALRLLGGETIP